MPTSDPIAVGLAALVAVALAVVVVNLLRLARGSGAGAAETSNTPVAHDRRTRRLDLALAASPILRRAVEVTANLAERKGALGSLERQLRAADVPVRPAELMLAHLVATLLLPVATLLLTRSPVKALLVLLAVGPGGPLTIRFLVARRRKRFGLQLPDALTALSGSLRAGRSIGQAMEAISREAPDPIGRELRKVVAEVRLGRALHETLADAAERVGSPDFKWAVLAMQIQAEVGGNLAELLDQVAATMRERSRMRLEVKALTAEGRASAMLLVVMVPALGGVMALMNPAYMAPLFNTSTGQVMLGISTVMIVGGYAWMNSMVKIDV